MPLHPWDFQTVAFQRVERQVTAMARCALCSSVVPLPMKSARPALRLGLSIVSPGDTVRRHAEDAAREIDSVGGSGTLLDRLAREGAALGELSTLQIIALGIALDEEAEVEALESSWRSAEEIAAIMDGELTEIPGFETFRRRVLGA
jgi:hypothetical protein